VTVLTAMGMDHAAIIGPTMEHIAQAKVGVIKDGAEVVSYGGNAVADRVFSDTCRARGAKLTVLDHEKLQNVVSTLEGNDFELARKSEHVVRSRQFGLSLQRRTCVKNDHVRGKSFENSSRNLYGERTIIAR